MAKQVIQNERATIKNRGGKKSEAVGNHDHSYPEITWYKVIIY